MSADCTIIFSYFYCGKKEATAQHIASLCYYASKTNRWAEQMLIQEWLIGIQLGL